MKYNNGQGMFLDKLYEEIKQRGKAYLQSTFTGPPPHPKFRIETNIYRYIPILDLEYRKGKELYQRGNTTSIQN